MIGIDINNDIEGGTMSGWDKGLNRIQSIV